MFLHLKAISFINLTVLATVMLLLHNYVTHDHVTLPNGLHPYNNPLNQIVGGESDSVDIDNGACVISNVDKFDVNASMAQLQHLILYREATNRILSRN